MLAEVETTRKPYFCPDCGWHPCRCCQACGQYVCRCCTTCRAYPCSCPLCVCGGRLVGAEGEQSCLRCHTRYPLVPTGRPPILARYPDASKRLFCPCGQVLCWNGDPATQPPRRCDGCGQRYRWPGDPEPLAGAAPSRLNYWFEPREDGRVPIAFLTDLNCMMCGRVMMRVRHDEPEFKPTRQHLDMRCRECGGNPTRDETHAVFGFVGSERVAMRPFGL